MTAVRDQQLETVGQWLGERLDEDVRRHGSTTLEARNTRRMIMQAIRLMNLTQEERVTFGLAFHKGARFLQEIGKLAIEDFENGDIWDEGLGDA